VLSFNDLLDSSLRVARVGEDLLCISLEPPPGAPAALQDRLARLTASERSVVELVVRGVSNPRIAALRECSPKTIANQLNAAYAKLGVSGRRALRALFAAGQR
jgi:DNA-binding CsgD family transcriptional regulator